MSNNIYPHLAQQNAMSLAEVQRYKSQALERKAQLEALKAQSGKAWTTELQDELDEVVLFLVDVAEVEEATKPEANRYKVPASERHLFHVQLVHGRRFNSFTGKEESYPYIQKFTRSEWNLFKENCANLGYIVLAILHEPSK